MKRRIWFLDIIRVIAFVFIIFYHMAVQLPLDGICDVTRVTPFYLNANLHIATLGVTLFFMISGAGLMLGSLQEFDLKTYFKKRFVRILVPFYIVYLCVLCVKLIVDPQNTFIPGIPRWTVIFTVLGIDTYISTCGIVSFTLGIGEWFLGCLIMIYVLFPLLRFCMKKKPVITFLAATVYYLVMIYFYPFQKVPMHMNFFVKIYGFILGMFLILYWEKIKKWTLALTLPVIAVFLFYPAVIPVLDELKTTVLSIAVFVTAVSLESIVERSSRVQKFLKGFCGIHYELFLVHHVIIQAITGAVCEKIVSVWGVLVLFICELIAMSAAAVVLKKTEGLLEKVFAKRKA